MRTLISAAALAAIASVGLPAAPAYASVGQPLSSLLWWAHHQKLIAGFHHVPDDGEGGDLFACRFGGYETLVRVFLDRGRIHSERIEVELPSDRPDAVALGIISRFFYEFCGGRITEDRLWHVTNILRVSLARTGLKEVSGDYLGVKLGLHLDTSPDNSYMSAEQQTWGTLFWRGDASAIGPQGPHEPAAR